MDRLPFDDELSRKRRRSRSNTECLVAGQLGSRFMIHSLDYLATRKNTLGIVTHMSRIRKKLASENTADIRIDKKAETES